MPEWYLVIAALGGLAALGAAWEPLLFVLPLLGGAIAASVVQALLGAAAASFAGKPRRRTVRARLLTVTALLHLLQPLARLVGRLQHGLTPWRRRGQFRLGPPWPRTLAALRKGAWQAPEEKLSSIEAALRESGAVVRRGGNFDRWDLEVHGGLLAGVRLVLAVEDHGPDTQLIRVRSWPTFSRLGVLLTVLFLVLPVSAARQHAPFACTILGGLGLLLAVRKLQEAGHSMGAVLATMQREAGES